MRRVFQKLCMVPTATIRLLAWDTLRALPGWASSAAPGPAGDGAAPAPLLSALGLESAIGAAERETACRFETVASVEALREALRSIGGGLAPSGLAGQGVLPALYKVPTASPHWTHGALPTLPHRAHLPLH